MNYASKVFYMFVVTLICIVLSDRFAIATSNSFVDTYTDNSNTNNELNEQPEQSFTTDEADFNRDDDDEKLNQFYENVKTYLLSRYSKLSQKAKRDEKKRTRISNLYRFNPQTSSLNFTYIKLYKSILFYIHFTRNFMLIPNLSLFAYLLQYFGKALPKSQKCCFFENIRHGYGLFCARMLT